MKKLVLAVVLGLIAGVANAAVDFALKDLDGATHKLSDYRGQWVIVNYWATWCPPCVEEMPELVFFHDKHKGKAVVIGVNMDEAPIAKVRDFVDEHFISYPIWQGEPGSDSPLGSVPGLPTTFLVSPTGEVIERKIGRVDQAFLEAWLNKYSGKK